MNSRTRAADSLGISRVTLYKKMKNWAVIAYFATLKGMSRSAAKQRAFELLERYGEPCPEAMVESALNHARLLEDNDFREFKISVKASDVFLAAAAYQGLAEACDYPLHLGVTEAGGMIPGTVKSSIGIGSLLWAGIGDTIRVSLSADPVEEVRVGFDILTVRFAVMHVALLGLAVGLWAGVDPTLLAIVLCAAAGAGIAPLRRPPLPAACRRAAVEWRRWTMSITCARRFLWRERRSAWAKCR